MNILILSWRGPGHPHVGGAEIATIEHAKAWIKAGHSITWFTSQFKGAKQEEYIDKIEIIRKGSEILGVQIQAFFWYLFSKHNKFDLVVDQFHGIPFFTPLYVKTKKLAFIHEVAKNVWALNPWPFPLNLLPTYIGSSIEPYIFRYLYKNINFMTVSESTKSDLEKWGIKSKFIHVIHNGTYKTEKIDSKSRIPTVMFLGALAKDKGIGDALKTFSLVFKKITNCKFWVVGKGDPDYITNLKRQARQLDLSANIKFMGFVSDFKKMQLLSKTWILVNPSAREGWGLVNIEANSVKTPVVAYNVPGIVDSVIDGKTGLLVKYGDYQALAQNCIKLMQQKQAYKIMSENAFNWSKNFSWEKSGNLSSKLIEKL